MKAILENEFRDNVRTGKKKVRGSKPGVVSRRDRLEKQLFASLRAAEEFKGTPDGALLLTAGRVIQKLLEDEEATVSTPPPHASAAAHSETGNFEPSEDPEIGEGALLPDEEMPDFDDISQDIRDRVMLDFFAQVNREATAGRAPASIAQLGRSFVAMLFAFEMPIVERYRYETASKELGCSLALFHRFVDRWCVRYGKRRPRAKPRRPAPEVEQTQSQTYIFDPVA